jgi:hypothetical protein
MNGQNFDEEFYLLDLDAPAVAGLSKREDR